MNGYMDSRRSYLSLKTAIRTSLLLVSAAALAACGGGGGGGGSDDPPPAQNPPPTGNPPPTTNPPPATNNPPTAEAGDAKTSNFPEPVTLQGVGSDPEGATVTYAWTATGPEGATVTLSAADAAATTAKFSAPGTYTFTLTVSDGTTNATDTTTVTVGDPLYPSATEWTAATPDTVGMNPALLDEAVTYATSVNWQDDLGGAGVVVRYGKAVRTWGDLNQKYDLKSTTKSIGGIALLLALDRNAVTPSATAASIWPGFASSPVSPDPNWPPTITVQQLSSHTAGYLKTDRNRVATPTDDGVLQDAPGAVWRYSDAGLNSLADVLTTALQGDLYSVLNTEVFAKIGIEAGAAQTETDPMLTRYDLFWRWNRMREPTLDGRIRRELASGIYANVDAMARIGYLFLREGKWGSEQLISEVAVNSVSQPAAGSATNADETNFPQAVQNYGLLWWTNKTGQLEGVPTDAYWAWGLGDSLIVVIPSLDLVIARAGRPDETGIGPRSWNHEWNGDYSVLAPFIGKIAEATTP